MKTKHIIAAALLVLLSFSARAGSVWAVSVGGSWGGGSAAIVAGNGCTTPYWGGGQAVVGWYPPTPVLPAPYYPPTPVYPVGTVAVAAPGVAVAVGGSTWAFDAFVSPWWLPNYTGYYGTGYYGPGYVYPGLSFAWYGGSSCNNNWNNCNRNNWNNCNGNGNYVQTYQGQNSRSYQGSPQGRQQPAPQQAFNNRAEPRTASFNQGNPQQRVSQVANPVALERPNPAASQVSRATPQWRNQAASPAIAERTIPATSQVAPQGRSQEFSRPIPQRTAPTTFNQPVAARIPTPAASQFQSQPQRPVAFNNANSQGRGQMANIPARGMHGRSR